MLMNNKSYNKVIYLICGIIIVGVACFAGIKFLSPDSISAAESTSSGSTLFSSTKAASTAGTTAIKTSKAAETDLTATSTSETDKTTKKSTTKAPSTSQNNPTKHSSTKLFTLPWTYPEIKTTTKATTAHAKGDYSYFDNCAFVGNSRVLDCKNYGLVDNVYAVVGLNVDTVFTKSVSGSNVPVIDELNGKHFDKIYLMFGDNECGWPNTDEFIRRYAKVVDAVHERVPEAEIYLQSILPISKKASDENNYGCNNTTINNLNKKIEKLAADKGVHYIAPAEAMRGSDGALPPEAASDGIHLKKKYCEIWLNYLIENS